MKLITLIIVGFMFIGSQSILPFLIPVIGGIAAGARIAPAAIRIGANAGRAAKGASKGAKAYDRYERGRE